MSQSSIPDVVGYSMLHAVQAIREAGLEIHSVEITAPPRSHSDAWNDSYRVVKTLCFDDGNIRLIICNPSQ